MKMPKLNVKLLDRILRHVKKEPRRFNMGQWVDSSVTAPCGTAACLAGWAVILGDPKGNTKAVRAKFIHLANNQNGGTPDTSTIFKRAMKALGLTYDEAKGMFLTYTGEDGQAAAQTAEQKIALIKTDRQAFVEKYGN